MKIKVFIAAVVTFLLATLVVSLSLMRKPDPRNLSYWLKAAGTKNWSGEAAQGNPEAQCFLGLTLIRTNFITMIGRVPRFSAIPLVGRLFFEKITYAIDTNIAQDQLAEAHQWIKKSADQGFAPAKEAAKLFMGRIPMPKQSTQLTPASAEVSKP